MSHLNTPYVASPREEFRQFAKSRIEGLTLTEKEEDLQVYKEAMAQGMERLEEMEQRGALKKDELTQGGEVESCN